MKLCSEKKLSKAIDNSSLPILLISFNPFKNKCIISTHLSLETHLEIRHPNYHHLLLDYNIHWLITTNRNPFYPLTIPISNKSPYLKLSIRSTSDPKLKSNQDKESNLKNKKTNQTNPLFKKTYFKGLPQPSILKYNNLNPHFINHPSSKALPYPFSRIISTSMED